MNRAIHSLTAVLALAGTLACAAPPPHVTQVPIACTQVSRETCAIAGRLGRGINLGNMLDAPREGDWGVKLEPAYIDLAADNFNTVRLPVRWSNHAAPTADATLDPKFAARVDQAVDALLARGAYVILDVHHYTQISGDPPHPHEQTVDPAVVDQRLINLWKQIATRYRDRPPRLIFELLNEPHGRLDGEPWNRLAAQALAAVRESNPTRTVMIGPGGWNSVDELPRLRLPADRNLIVSIHNYDPFDFTHQGIDYLAKPFPVGTRCCDAGQRRKVEDALDKAQRWSQAHGVPLHLGEFGAFEKADIDSRAAYTRLVRDEAEKRGIGWTYWELASTFGVWSPANGQWVEPLRRALLD
ncbi:MULTISPECIES: glycoside hydrolase family 5 protein [Ramlibacter]|uniref:Glycoside hydrolase family 5 protein n=1 Tax=Ramlibacter aquaticus TaxID=2780094 RepID=A0ABR9SJ13_9BURK|nr:MULTISPECIES: glycoside hydrolase family 5 protein [Ramlibacter]MBE7941747.1 glycoside hydrolase family 5 protein [Ramlibacter aquaticus]